MHTARDSELFKQQEDLFGPSDEEFEEEEEIDEEDVRPRKVCSYLDGFCVLHY